MGIDLAGRTVLVTGASIGIGRALALQFAAAGCRLALTYFEHRAEAAEVAERCRGLGAPDVVVVSLQQADDDSIRTLFETVIDRFGALDILVNNAGVVVWKPFLKQDFGEIESQLAIDLQGLIKMTWVFLPMVTDAIINIGSQRIASRHRHAGAVLRRQVGRARLHQSARPRAPGQAHRVRASRAHGDAHERHAGHAAGARRRGRARRGPR